MKFRAPGATPIQLGLTSGHSIVITSDEAGTEVPLHFRAAAITAGCELAGVGSGEGAVAKEKPTKPVKKTEEQKRLDALIAATEKLLDSDDEKSFGEDGKPDLKTLAKLVDFKVTDAERDAAWAVVEERIKQG